MRKVKIGLALAVVVGACGLSCTKAQDFVNQVQANTVMVSELITSPDESVAGNAIPGQVVANVFLGTIDPAQLTAPPTGIAGAQVQVSFNDQVIQLNDKGNGTYEVSSVDNNALVYQVGTAYHFQAIQNLNTFSQDVTAPDREGIVEFHQGLLAYDAGPINLDGGFPFPDGGPGLFPDGGFDLPGFMPVTSGQNMTLTREPTGSPRNAAVTVVIPLDSQFQPQQPSFTDPPETPLGLVTLVANPAQYKQDTVTVDGSKAWPDCSSSGYSDYVVSVTSLQTGNNEGNNLFVGGSTAFAGSADAAPAHCSP
jgi:hypothetical protein